MSICGVYVYCGEVLCQGEMTELALRLAVFEYLWCVNEYLWCFYEYLLWVCRELRGPLPRRDA